MVLQSADARWIYRAVHASGMTGNVVDVIIDTVNPASTSRC